MIETSRKTLPLAIAIVLTGCAIEDSAVPSESATNDTDSVTTAPPPSPVPVPQQTGEDVLLIDTQAGRVAPESFANLDSAVAAFAAGGEPELRLFDVASGSGAAGASHAILADIAAQELMARGVPPAALAMADGAGIRLQQSIAAAVETNSGIAGPTTIAQPVPTPSNPGVIVATASIQTPISEESPNPLKKVTAWLIDNKTLTQRAFGALADECERQDGKLSGDCRAAVRAGVGGFEFVPDAVRREFSFLLATCQSGDSSDSCRSTAAIEREFRALRRAELRPSPLVMTEGVRTRFTAAIVHTRRAETTGSIGEPLNPDIDAGPNETAEDAGNRATIIPFSRKMCFLLDDTGEGADDASEGAFEIAAIGEPCRDMAMGSSRRFQPEWYVTPLRAGRLKLYLQTQVVINGTEQAFPHNDYPLIIDVSPAPSRWEKMRSWMTEATHTVDTATLLAKALAALFVVIGGWTIWRWFKRRGPDSK